MNRRKFLEATAAAAVATPAIVARTTSTAGATLMARSPIARALDGSGENDLDSKIRLIGGWLERPEPLQPELTGSVDADAIVVGGGFAGLSTSLELAARGAKVVLLEREFCGFGASGRNAGYLGQGQGLEWDLFIDKVSRDQARQIVQYYDAGVAYVEGRIEQHGIDCDYNKSGHIRAGIEPSQEENVRESMRIGVELGSPAEFLDSAAMRARGIPPAFLFGCYFKLGGTLNPGKYVLGLRRAALAAGVRIFEGTPVQSFTPGKIVAAKTAKGTASAPFMVLATNAYTPELGVLGDKVFPLRVSAIETQPLSDVQLASHGWPRREGIITAHLSMESHRLTANNTLVITSKRFGYEYGGQAPNVADEDAYRALAEALHERFPTLLGLGIRACWSGYVSAAYDFLPVVGADGDQPNVLYAAGCSGHGIGTQSLVGRLLAAEISGKPDPFMAALRHKTPKTLPEPLQWCVVRSALAAANLLDDHTDRKARRLKNA